MNQGEQQYLDLLRDLIVYGDERETRNGVVLSSFGRQLRFDLADGFPLLTTKKVHLKSIIAELLWMISGDTNVRTLQAQGVKIWDEWADEDGDLGPVYGEQWRAWGRYWNVAHGPIDQLARVVNHLRHDPHGRRHVVSAWSVHDLPAMALPPCHCLFQFYVTRGRLDCQLYQRSADAFLGLPFNIASYALLTMLVAQVVGLTPGRFFHTLGDVHLYRDHVQQARTQIGREPTPFPAMSLAHRSSIDGWLPGDFKLSGYYPHPALPAPVSK